MFQLIIVLLAFLLKFAMCDNNLVCYYIIHSDGYNCHVENTFTKNIDIDSVNGTHRRTKSNSLVDVLFVPSASETEYLPYGICKFFNNLIEFESYGVNLLEIHRNIFTDCERLGLLLIQNAKFSTIPEDVFYDVPNLTYLEIGKTKLSYLPEKIFENNQKLIKIDLRENQLAVINAIFPSTVTSIFLLKNDCISKNFTIFSIEIYQKCSNQSELLTTTIPENSANNLQAFIRNLELLVDANKQAIEELQTQPNILNDFNEMKQNFGKFQKNLLETADTFKNIQSKIKKLELNTLDQNTKIYNANQEIQKIKSVSFSSALTSDSLDSQKVDQLETSIIEIKRENVRQLKRFEWNEFLHYISVAILLVSVTFFILAILAFKFNRRNIRSLMMEEY